MWFIFYGQYLNIDGDPKQPSVLYNMMQFQIFMVLMIVKVMNIGKAISNISYVTFP